MIKNFTKFSYFVLGIFFTSILSLSFTTFAQIKPIEEQVATTTSKYITATTTIYTLANNVEILYKRIRELETANFICQERLLGEPNKGSSFWKWYKYWYSRL